MSRAIKYKTLINQYLIKSACSEGPDQGTKLFPYDSHGQSWGKDKVTLCVTVPVTSGSGPDPGREGPSLPRFLGDFELPEGTWNRIGTGVGAIHGDQFSAFAPTAWHSFPSDRLRLDATAEHSVQACALRLDLMPNLLVKACQ